MSGDGRGIVPHPVDEVGIAPVLEALADDVHSRNRCQATSLKDLAVVAEHRHLQPRVPPGVPGRPQNGADAGSPQLELTDDPSVSDCGWFGRRGHLLRQAVAGNVVIDVSQDAPHAMVGMPDRDRDIVRERNMCTVDTAQPAGKRDAERTQRGQIDLGICATNQLERCLAAGRNGIGGLIDSDTEGADLLEPEPDVPTPVPPRQPTVATNGQHDVAT